MVAVGVDELAREEEGGAEDLATAVKIAKEKDPLILFIDVVKIKQSYVATIILNLITLHSSHQGVETLRVCFYYTIKPDTQGPECT